MKHAEDDIDTFVAWWAVEVAEEFSLDSEPIVKIFDDGTDDPTWQGVEDLFWYGDGIGFDHVPAILINGKLQKHFPETEDEWLKVINSAAE